MNGAESLVRTLLGGGVEVCFANPGTSEMHFVAALDRIDGMRCVLCLFEGVVTGAADGYGRMAEKPAATLLHLGPGLANGLANLHNARRAATPIVNIVGDHATYHRQHDTPLTSDIETAARPFSNWVRTSGSARAVASDAAEAIVVARTPPGQIATLILPADTAWNPAEAPAAVPNVPARAQVAERAVTEAVRMLRSGARTALLLAGSVLRAHGLQMADRIAAATGARLLVGNSNARVERGAGRVAAESIPYVVDQAVAALADLQQLILVGATPPTAFFAYPNKPSVLTPADCRLHVLARHDEDAVQALEWLVDAVGARAHTPKAAAYQPPTLASGAITLDALGQSIAALIPEQAIVVDESVTSGRSFLRSSRSSHPHDWLKNMGGSIGFGLPVATGAAIACPDRKVLCLEADGSGMYTLQALWTHAREGLDVTTVVFSNRSYAILRNELANVQAGKPGRKALDMLDLGRPDLNWTGLARSMGVEAGRATDMDTFNRELQAGLRSKGPYLIEVVL
ncbi:MAG: acetolactate synthase large subunit [Proteobacteria bacterium]|nr:acetolactate synthase large subunit [Pseudomonadota bacterium]